MAESEWLTCTDPTPMLAFLRGRASDRKLRLFAAACFGRPDLLPDARQPQRVRESHAMDVQVGLETTRTRA